MSDYLKEVREARAEIKDQIVLLMDWARYFDELGNPIMWEKLWNVAVKLNKAQHRIDQAIQDKISEDLQQAREAFFSPLNKAIKPMNKEENTDGQEDSQY